MDVEEHRAACVREVRRVDLAAREVVDEPRVDRAAHELARFRHLAGAVDVVENPSDLGRGEVRVWHEAGALTDELAVALRDDPLNERCGAAALPHDGVIDGLAGLAIPHDNGLALVCDADRVDAVRVDSTLELHLDHTGDLRGENLDRILLDPARMRVLHGERPLRHSYTVAKLVKEDRANARRAGVERHDAAIGSRRSAQPRGAHGRAHNAVHDGCHVRLLTTSGRLLSPSKRMGVFPRAPGRVGGRAADLHGRPSLFGER